MQQLDVEHAIIQFLVILERRNERHATDKMMRCLVSSAEQAAMQSKAEFLVSPTAASVFFCISANLTE